jgi:hypothetical protein
LAALEYPCVSLSATTSISAGARNEYVYGIGSVLLWTKNGDCQGMTNGDSTRPVVCPQVVTPCCAFAVLDLPLTSCTSHIALQLHRNISFVNACVFTRPMQYNFYPNDGECVKPTTNPPNEFSAGALGNDASKSWRFFLNQNSQACRGGVTTTGIITNGKIFGGVSNSNHIHIHSTNVSFQVLGISSFAQEMYGLCVNGFADVSERRHTARSVASC